MLMTGAYRTDPTSAFGGIIAFNRELDAATAKAIVERQFVEVIAAPAIAADALRGAGREAERARARAGRSRAARRQTRSKYRSVTGGLLVQIARYRHA